MTKMIILMIMFVLIVLFMLYENEINEAILTICDIIRTCRRKHIGLKRFMKICAKAARMPDENPKQVDYYGLAVVFVLVIFMLAVLYIARIAP